MQRKKENVGVLLLFQKNLICLPFSYIKVLRYEQPVLRKG